MALLDRLFGRPQRDTTPETTIDPNTAYDLLKNTRRRAVIRALIDDFQGSCSLRDLAEFVAAMEHPTETPETISGPDRKRVYVSLYQTHVPKLAECGVVEYHDGEVPVSEDEIVATELTHTLYDVLDQNEALLGGGA